MSIELSVRKMESLLKRPPEKRDGTWAHDLCTASRFVHIDVWRYCPQQLYVRDEIVPLLVRAEKELKGLVGEQFDKKKVEQYILNDRRRISNISDRYLQGKASAFRPESSLSEAEAQVG